VIEIRYSLLVLALGSLSTLGCGQVLDIPDDPQVVQQATGPWSCLSDTTPAAPPETSKAKVQVFACDFVSPNCATPVTGLTAQLCAKVDPGCKSPLQKDIKDTNGMFEFEVDTGGATGKGFDGYLMVMPPVAMCTDEATFGPGGPLCGLASGCDVNAPDQNCMVPVYAPAMVFFNPPIVADTTTPVGLPLFAAAGLPAIVQAAGATLDPTKGNLFITTLDCDGNRASGVTYEIAEHQSEVTQLYVDNGVVSNTAFETDTSGIGGFIGVPAGFAEVTAFNSANDKIGKVGLQAAPFTMTYGFVTPSP